MKLIKHNKKILNKQLCNYLACQDMWYEQAHHWELGEDDITILGMNMSQHEWGAAVVEQVWLQSKKQS